MEIFLIICIRFEVLSVAVTITYLLSLSIYYVQSILPHEIGALSKTASKWQGQHSILGLWANTVSSFYDALSIRTLLITVVYSVTLFELCDCAYPDTAIWVLVGHLRMWNWCLVALEWGEHADLRSRKAISYRILGEPERMSDSWEGRSCSSYCHG